MEAWSAGSYVYGCGTTWEINIFQNDINHTAGRFVDV